jgi:hypothetical protein
MTLASELYVQMGADARSGRLRPGEGLVAPAGALVQIGRAKAEISYLLRHEVYEYLPQVGVLRGFDA